MGRGLAARRLPEVRQRGRTLGGAEEVAKIVAALIESDFVTGEIVRIDGGRHVA